VSGGERVRRWAGAAARGIGPRLPRRRPVLALPADVADAVAAFLAEADAFGDQRDEAACYIGNAFERFRTTMAVLPDLTAGSPVLELGANPYFATRLLRRRGLDVTCANWFGDGVGAQGVQELANRRTGAVEAFPYDHFNVEVDRFPYEDGAFALVLCCEILEHLPTDPIHMLAEIHRVLAPGGALVLTTPNATRTENVANILRGDNVYEHLSGYGAYGRHNREYTRGELAELLATLGYVVEHLSVHDTYWRPPRRPVLPAGAVRTDRGDTLFVRARAEGPPRWRYPAWLFQSRQAIVRVVRPDLVVGVNDDVQSRGLHPLDDLPDGPVAWTGAAPSARVVVVAPGGPGRLRIDGRAAPLAAGAPVRLEVRTAVDHVGPATGPVLAAWDVASDGRPFELAADVDLGPGGVWLDLATDRTWSPAEAGASSDGRRLGLALQRVAVEPG
jgi:SAM-dependent methyltransferase